MDSFQQELLTKIQEQLKAGKLRNVCDTPKYWVLYTTAEIEYIIKYRRDYEQNTGSLPKRVDPKQASKRRTS